LVRVANSSKRSNEGVREAARRERTNGNEELGDKRTTRSSEQTKRGVESSGGDGGEESN
jgi:hypothetical protein